MAVAAGGSAENVGAGADVVCGGGLLVAGPAVKRWMKWRDFSY